MGLVLIKITFLVAVMMNNIEFVFLQVPCSGGSLLYVWCTLITMEPDSYLQQRAVSVMCYSAQFNLL